MAKITTDIVVEKVYQSKLKELAVGEKIKIPRAGYTGTFPPKAKRLEINEGRRGYFFEPMGEAILATRKH